VGFLQNFRKLEFEVLGFYPISDLRQVFYSSQERVESHNDGEEKRVAFSERQERTEALTSAVEREFFSWLHTEGRFFLRLTKWQSLQGCENEDMGQVGVGDQRTQQKVSHLAWILPDRRDGSQSLRCGSSRIARTQCAS
jgi:hypothetical protein